MERGSAKHGPRLDEDLEREARAAARANPPVRGEDWPDPEAPDAEPLDAEPSSRPNSEPNVPTPADLDPRRR